MEFNNQQLNEELKKEVEELRKAGQKFLAGELSKQDFKGISGGMGVYAQQDQSSFMLRLRTPSGIVSREHLLLILHYAKKYKLEKIHLTTRQAIQLHNLGINETCDIMLDAIDHGLYSRGAGGNYPRNVSLSPLSGVDLDEAFDVTTYALQAGEYFLEQVRTIKLPRKLKVAFSSSAADLGCAGINDVGFMAVLEGETPKFHMWLAGGLGGGSELALSYPQLIDPEDVLYYVDAMVRLFIAEGDYENKAKARTRFIPKRMGKEAFFECYEKHLKESKESNEYEKIIPIVEKIPITREAATSICIPQRQRGYYTAVIHPLCGQLLTSDLIKIIEFINSHKKAEIRLSMEENMYIRNLTKAEVEEVLDLQGKQVMKTPLGMSVSCVGTPSCQMGILQSQALYRNIVETFGEKGLEESLLPRVHISGCPNSCTRHQTSLIGFAGRKAKVDGVTEDVFQLHIGGKVKGFETCFGEIKGLILTRKIPSFLMKLDVLLKETHKDIEAIRETEELHQLIAQYSIDNSQ